ncbi:hypothetical protein BC833DRAFT_407983 [Globomyces pollinis-pini]|nr:hypothetical protein BC833DRAFT_407983 [Globomyces pollinis-pini]
MYISFLEELKSETKKEPEKLDKTDIEYLLSNPKEQPKTTPLLEALRSQKSSATKKKSKAKAKKSQVTLLSRPETSNNNESSSSKEPSQVDISQDNRNRDPENRNGNVITRINQRKMQIHLEMDLMFPRVVLLILTCKNHPNKAINTIDLEILNVTLIDLKIPKITNTLETLNENTRKIPKRTDIEIDPLPKHLLIQN